jgi:phage-related protein
VVGGKMRTDRNYVRTAQDLERKYNFTGMSKNIEQTKQGLIKTNAELTNFTTMALADLEVLQNQVDGSVTTWFFSGIPTLQNEPAESWNVSEYPDHVSDLYYDTNSGEAYKFVENSGVYSWERQNNSDISQALALANAAQDTADNKRRVFVTQPTPPYDNGDLWFNDLEIYRCQISKGAGQTFGDNDFIIATKYTDDTVANRVNDELQVVKGTVLTVKENVDEFKIQFDTTTKTIQDDLKENIESVEKMSYSFDTDDLTIAKSNDPVNTRINNRGLKVYSFDEKKAIFNDKGSGIQKLIVVGDAQLGNLQIVKATDDNGDACTDIHYLISNIQTLDDLEV